MDTVCALTSSKGVGALATIEIIGACAADIVSEIFFAHTEKKPEFKVNNLYLGIIKDDGKSIDEVTVGVEAQDTIAIHCHGNPLIVRDIIQLIKNHGANTVTAEQAFIRKRKLKNNINTIELEVDINIPFSKTLEGAKILFNQKQKGLNKKIRQWLSEKENISINKIKEEIKVILLNSHISDLLIHGCKTVLIGPPNSGKSTLINNLAGKNKAIVSDIAGTTRDYITAECRICPLKLELFDTAGLDRILIEKKGNIEKLSQEISLEIISQADLILLILDASMPLPDFDTELAERVKNKKTITVLNKSDLGIVMETDSLPEFAKDFVKISALHDENLKELKKKILYSLNVIDYDLESIIAFTERQKKLLNKILDTEKKAEIFRKLNNLSESELNIS